METVLRAVVMYAVLLVVIRLSGRRTLSQMTVFDFVIVLVVSETTQQALMGNDFSIINAVIVMITLFTVDIGLSYLKGKSAFADKLMDGQATVLVTHGKPDDRALKRARIGIDDILSSARQSQGLERLEQIKYAVLEAGGQISVIPEDAAS